jgi:high-affinity nickel-transport protein
MTTHTTNVSHQSGKPASVFQGSLKFRVITIFTVIIAATVVVWLWAFVALGSYPLLLGSAFLAYTFGLRHAVDADHIAAVDNVTRKLMQEGKRPVNIGFFFALGHSSVVVLMSICVAATAGALRSRFSAFQQVGGIISTLVSASFLLLLAFLNIVVLVQIYKAFVRVKRTGRYDEEDINVHLAKGGLLARIYRPLFGLIRHGWQMIPLGFLFGLGFDTSTEVALLGMSASQAQQGISFGAIMVFPALFTVGMVLIDTADGVLMLGAYQWAFVTPLRKLYYNMTITGVSVIVALLIGGIETLGLIGDHYSFTGTFWEGVGTLNEHFNTIGFFIIGIFISAWIFSFLFYRWNKFDEIVVEPISNQ